MTEGCSLDRVEPAGQARALTVDRRNRAWIIGHNATVHGCTVEDGVLIGMGAIVMNGVHVGKEALIGTGALVPEGREVPPREVNKWWGVPGQADHAHRPADIVKRTPPGCSRVDYG